VDAEKALKQIKTECCDSDWHVKDSKFICDKCNKDVTIEIIYTYQATNN